MQFQLNPSEFLILIVDDTETNIKLLSHVLRGEGFTPIVAFNGTDAIELIKARKPELVLLDIMMPDMTGYEVCRIIKSDENLSSIPIIFLSALSETSDKVEGFEAGGVDYITKPYQKDEVLARIRTHLVLGKLQKEREERIEILRNRELELQELNSKKDQLVRIVSHDIKNPLTGIVGLANLIRNTPNLPEGEIDKMLGVMESSGKKLMDLVKEVLDSEVESTSKESLKLTESYLKDLAEKVISVNQPKAILKDIQLNLVEKLVTSKMMLDHSKMEIALNNLVANALKFTEREGNVTLHVVSDSTKVLFKVEDDGVGIPQRVKESMFGNETGSVQNSHLGTEGEKGTGLGLEVVEKYINMHKGRVWVESQEGVGSTFFIELPINQ